MKRTVLIPFPLLLIFFLFFLSSCFSSPEPQKTAVVRAECEKRVVMDQDPDICLYKSDCESSCFYTCKGQDMVVIKELSVFSKDQNNTRWCDCTCKELTEKIIG